MKISRRTGLVFLVGIAAFGLGVFQVLSIPRLSREIGDAETRLQGLQQKNQQLAEVLSEIKTIESNLEVVQVALPVSEDVPALIMQLEEIAKQSGVAVQHLGFGGNGEKEAAASSVKKVSLTAVVVGSNESLLTFLRNLEDSSRVVNITNFRFSPTQSGEEAALTITLGVEAFYLPLMETVSPETPLTLDTVSKEYIELIRKVKALRVYKSEVAE